MTADVVELHFFHGHAVLFLNCRYLNRIASKSQVPYSL